MYYKIFALLGVFLIFFSILEGCTIDETSSVNNGHKSDLQKTSPDTIEKVTKQMEFKSWLRDTLLTLKSGKTIFNEKYTINYDSLSLTLNLNYDFIAKMGKSYSDKHINALISLLKDYDEYPKHEFRLIFMACYFYYPSSARFLKRDIDYELKDIHVIDLDKKTNSNYSYIHGRFSGKVISTQVQKDSVNLVRYEFIWDGNILKKIKL